jgi:hypothetical protein
MKTLVGPISKFTIPGNQFSLGDSTNRLIKVTLPIIKDTNDEINKKIRRLRTLDNYRYLILQYDKSATPFGQILNMEILYIDPLLKN